VGRHDGEDITWSPMVEEGDEQDRFRVLELLGASFTRRT
jgi:hypothetical protein